MKIERVNLDDAMQGGGTYGGNLKKKLNSRPPKRKDLPKIKLPDLIPPENTRTYIIYGAET